MNAGFTFADARRTVDYFARLGVSHLYLSPILAARKGSMHGYDVVDHTRINPELGTEAELRALAADLRARRMGLIVDIVPNHMGIGPENALWEDVLANGERSRYARWFDITWNAGGSRDRKVVLPILGDELDAVLARGELAVRVHERESPRVVYFQNSFPLDPSTLPPELQLTTFDAEETGELVSLFSGKHGEDRLRELLNAQHYRLVNWRRGSDEINYRRFFDVNDLVALRAEDDDVFRESHALMLRLASDGVIDGVRVDHIDGLRDPAAYLRKLRDALPPGAPIFVEKILSDGEHLRDWPVEGTTGYEFMNDLEDVFIDPAGFDALEASYRRIRHMDQQTTFRELARSGKLATLNGPLRADVERLAALALPIARALGKRWSVDELSAAIAQLTASFSVYRTYIAGEQIDERDRVIIERAVEDARVHSPETAERVRLIADVLLDAANLNFAQRFQQLTGPAAAKGVEDTALYVYVPIVSRNEVGGAPDRPLHNAVARFHEGNRLRAEKWPLGLNATNTHDTKRSADVRARIDALTGLPEEWIRSVRRWRKLNARHRETVNGRLAPDTNTEYLIYQILVSLWPPPRSGRRSDDLPDRAWRDSAHERLARYARKAAREAKTCTNWTEPNEPYERALAEFIASILEPADDAPFLVDVARFVSLIARAGATTSLARIALHLLAPGTPDIYQGDELWNFTLVDPDNRQPVDYDKRRKLLEGIDSIAEPTDLFDPRHKLLVTHRLLALRRELPDLFHRGSYIPLAARGPAADHIIAFARTHGDQRLIVVAPRLAAETLEGTSLELPPDLAGFTWESRLTNEIPTQTLELASLLSTIPVAVLSH
jgi:(1->4)-alpha-D-glucan 1-alpha-D-glucosylmutase